MEMRRWHALIALLLFVVGVVCLVITTVVSFPHGLIAAALLVAAAWFALGALRERGRGCVVRLVVSLVLLAAAFGVVLVADNRAIGLVAIAALLLSAWVAKPAFRRRVNLPPATPPKRAIVVWNPKSGGGKAVKNNLAEEARKRGIEPIELKPGDDLVQLVQDAVARGADGLAAAGGDGTQALVATIAAEHNLPFACIPAGTRNHFALDLGVDRNDVVGALDAFVNGGERRVDLAEVNGRVFVNNVSLGLYAEAVQRDEYRDAKLRTLLDTAPDVLGTKPGDAAQLRWRDEYGDEHESAAVVLVSNNPYRLTRAMGSGTRPRMDLGVLGVAAAVGTSALRQWAAAHFHVDADRPVPLGVDGEALVMDPPLEFTSRPAALRVRIAPQHPAASPSAFMPEHPIHLIGALLGIIAGRG
jgi:diacylglycerol kinase family enzyme